VVPLRLPPLRERSDDLPDLVKHFFSQIAEEGLPVKSLDAASMERLKSYRWPGNVREVENLVRRLAALYSQEVITLNIIESELSDIFPTSEMGQGSSASRSLGEAVEQHLQDYFKAHGDSLPTPGLHDRVLREVERPLIMLSLSETKGNQVRAAEMLGINRNTLRKKIRELDIEVVRGIK